MPRILHYLRIYRPRLSTIWLAALFCFCAAVFALTWLWGGEQESGRRLRRVASLTALLGYIFFLLGALVFSRHLRNWGVITRPSIPTA